MRVSKAITEILARRELFDRFAIGTVKTALSWAAHNAHAREIALFHATIVALIDYESPMFVGAAVMEEIVTENWGKNRPKTDLISLPCCACA